MNSGLERRRPALTVRPATSSTNEFSEDKPTVAFLTDSPTPSSGIPAEAPASQQRELNLPEVFPLYPFV
jgi:hypothetical protein